MESGLVFDIKKYSIHDGPGIRTTVFFKGCPLNCWWCHNPESQASAPEMILHGNRCIRCGACVEICPQHAIRWAEGAPVTDRAACKHCGTCAGECYAQARERIGKEMTTAQVMTEVESDIAFYDQSGGGATFSGGEPLLQRDFLLALLQACKAKDIHTVVDTSGFAAWESFNLIREFVDLFLFDLKLIDNATHREYTGVPNAPILRNLRRLSQHRHGIMLRVPLIPGINDDDETIGQIGAFAASLAQVDGVDILPYHAVATDKYSNLGKPYRLSGMRPPSLERVERVALLLSQFGLNVTVGGQGCSVIA